MAYTSINGNINLTSPAMLTGPVPVNSVLVSTGGGGSGWSMHPSHVNNYYDPLVISGHGGKEIVRVKHDGSVVWASGYNIDEAAEKLAESISLSVDMKAGITKQVKTRMRDIVFEEIIELSKLRGGVLSTDDLTFAYESSKIIEKLKGE